MKVLRCLEGAGVTWSPFERLIMFKIFCLSIPLYIGPLIALLKLSHYKAEQSAEAVILFQTLLEEGLKWVFSCNKVTYVERNLAGLPLVERILYNTARTLKKQVTDSRTVTAATVSYENSKTNASGLLNHELIPKLRYVKFPERFPEKPLKAAVQSETLDFLLKEGSMGSYCSKMSRGPNGVCRELKLKGEKAHFYLKWRRNKPLPVRCPICDERSFSRKCYKCLLEKYGDLPSLFKSHFDSSTAELKDITALDIALNIQWYEFFDAALQGKGWLKTFSKCGYEYNALNDEQSVSELNDELNLEIPEYSEDFIEML